MAEETKSVGNSLMDTIISSDIPDMVVDLGEVAIDALLQDGPLRDVPVIGSLLGAARSVSAFRDYFLLRKIITFLNGINDVDPKDREAFAREMENNPKQRQEVGGKLIVYIDRLDDQEKADLLARLFKARLKRKITMDQFFRFAAIVDRIYINDIYTLVKSVEASRHATRFIKEAAFFYQFGLSEISFDERLLNNHIGGLFDSSSHIRSSFDKFLKFQFTRDALTLVDILADKHGGEE